MIVRTRQIPHIQTFSVHIEYYAFEIIISQPNTIERQQQQQQTTMGRELLSIHIGQAGLAVGNSCCECSILDILLSYTLPLS